MPDAVVDIFQEVKKLYGKQKYAEALVAVQAILVDDPTNAEALGWEGQCHYQLGQYPESMRSVTAAGDNQRALQFLFYLYCYRKTGFQNRAKMQEIAARLHDQMVVANGFLILVREPGNEEVLTFDAALEHVMRHIGSESVNAAHLANNAGRLLRDLPRDNRDRLAAVGLLSLALVKYGIGDGKKAHHKAGVLYWMARTFEDLGDTHSALHVAQDSVLQWTTACEADPQNSGHQQRRQNVVEYVEKLQQGLS